jgi:hypothetical protein
MQAIHENGATKLGSTSNAGLSMARERARTLRMQKHIAVALLAALTILFVAPYVLTILGLIAVSVLVYVVFDSLGRAVDARLGYWWGWLYPDKERPTRFDLVVDRVVHLLLAVANSVIRRLASAGRVDEPPGRVQPL